MIKQVIERYEITKEYKDIMKYCYLNNITLCEVKLDGN